MPASANDNLDIVTSFVRTLTTIPTADLRLSDTENWSSGTELSDAPHLFADNTKRDELRGADNLERAGWVHHSMCLDCLEALFGGRLIAFGVISPALPTASPVRISSAFFKPGAANIDWDKNLVRGFGVVFEAVCLLASDVTDQGLAGLPPAQKDNPLSASKRGRTSFDPELADAARAAAFDDPDFTGRVQEKQIAAIRTEAARMFPAKFHESGPGRSTVARYVKAQRNQGWPDLSRPENPENPE